MINEGGAGEDSMEVTVLLYKNSIIILFFRLPILIVLYFLTSSIEGQTGHMAGQNGQNSISPFFPGFQGIVATERA